MEKVEVRTDAAPAPVGPYSQAILAGGFVFTAGQIALIPGTSDMDNDTIEAETARVMDNLKAVLEEAGSSLEKIVKTTIFVSDMNDFGRINAVYGAYFEDVPPARSTVEVASLPKNAGVEIECVALV